MPNYLMHNIIIKFDLSLDPTVVSASSKEEALSLIIDSYFNNCDSRDHIWDCVNGLQVDSVVSYDADETDEEADEDWGGEMAGDDWGGGEEENEDDE